MEAARMAARRGHQVTLYEKGSYLGGLIPVAAIVKDLETDDLTRFVQYLVTQLKKEKVTVKTNTEVTPQLVKKEKPDVLIVAAGSRAYRIRYSGSDHQGDPDGKAAWNAEILPEIFQFGTVGKTLQNLDAG